MTPAARVQAAIGIVDRIAAGDAAEKALTQWARNSRFAGSKDRAAVRDLVFDTLRRWRSSAALGGGETGRARLIGVLRDKGQDLNDAFSGQGHGPSVLTPQEIDAGDDPKGAAAWDLPDWILSRWMDDLGQEAEPTALALRDRASVYLRVNSLRASLASAQALLAQDGIATVPHELSPFALRVTEGARRVHLSDAYSDGHVELQDLASQAVIDHLPLKDGMRVLDYCAGGGGKTLAMAARLGGGPVYVHDSNPKRMTDLPARATRAGVKTRVYGGPKDGQFDLVLCDVPCSGSGSWRRSPEGKWRLTESALETLCASQADILDTCQDLVAPGGVLAYVTCSVLHDENIVQIKHFKDRFSGWSLKESQQYLPKDGGDGLFVAILTKLG